MLQQPFDKIKIMLEKNFTFLRPVSFIALLLMVVSFSACKNGETCSDVNCPESFILNESPESCCFLLEQDDITFTYEEDFQMDLNNDGINDLLFDGSSILVGGNDTQNSIALRPQNGAEILTTVSGTLKTFVDGDELITNNETFRDEDIELVRVTSQSINNNWPTGSNFSIMGVKIPIPGDTENFDYAYICLRVGTGGPSVTIAYYASQYGN